MKKLLPFTFTILFAACTTTDNFYQGKVVDEHANPLEHVLVTDDHNGKSTQTNALGYFHLARNDEWLSNLIFAKDGFRIDTFPTVFHRGGETTAYRFITKDTTRIILTKIASPAKIEVAPSAQEEIVHVGTEVNGDFDGNKVIDFAQLSLIKKGEGNPVEDGTPDEYAVIFKDAVWPPISVGCCDFKLVNEGDLDGDGGDELSVFQAPMNGCTYTMCTYTCKNGVWKRLIAPFLIPTGCDPFNSDVIQQRIFLDHGTVYYYETDVNDPQFKLIRTKATLQ